MRVESHIAADALDANLGGHAMGYTYRGNPTPLWVPPREVSQLVSFPTPGWGEKVCPTRKKYFLPLKNR